MTDLSQLSDEELKQLYAAGQSQPQNDLSSMSDADLIKAYQGSSQPSVPTVPQVAAPSPQVKQPDKNWSDLPGNILPSLGGLAKNIFTAVSHPIDTLSGLGDIAVGGINKVADLISPPDAATQVVDNGRQDKAFEAMSGFMGKRYGGLDEIKNTLINDPAGAAADASMLLGGVGGALKAGGLGKAGSAVSRAGELTNPLLPVQKLIEAAGSGAVKAGTGISDFMTGKNISDAALKGSPEFTSNMRQGGNVGDVLTEIQAKMAQAKMDLNNQYGQMLSGLNTPPTPGLQSLLAKLKRGASSSDANGFDYAATVHPQTGDFSLFTKRAAIKDNKHINAALKEVLSSNDATPGGMDTLRRNLGFYANEAKNNGRPTEASALIDEIRSNLKKGLEADPTMQGLGYGEANANYANFKNFKNLVDSELSLNAKNPQTAVRKLNQVFRDNFKGRNELMQQLDQVLGSNTLDKLAGIEASNWLPGGLRKVAASASAPFAMFHPATLLGGAAMSPRINAELWNLIGKSARQYRNLKKVLPPEALRYLAPIANGLDQSGIQ
jgi:hypothetical protein